MARMPAGGLLDDRPGAGRDRDEGPARLPHPSFHAELYGSGALCLLLALGERHAAPCFPDNRTCRYAGEAYDRPRRRLSNGFRLPEGLPHGYARHYGAGYADLRQR